MKTIFDSAHTSEAGTGPVTGPLSTVLLGPDARREHGFWRRLVATEPFRRPLWPPPGPTPDERLALAHARLRTLNSALDSAARPAADPRALAALHEWLAPVDPAFATVAGIHYNLFLGSLLDHDADRPRDLSDFLGLRRIGTFLCTEVAHGNDAAAIETTATYDRGRDGFVLHTPHAGAQKFMPNTSPAGGPKSGLVAARLIVDGRDQGSSCCWCRSRTRPGPARNPGAPASRTDGQSGRPLPDLLRPGLRGPRGTARRRAGAGRRRRGVPQRHRGRRRRFLTSIGRVTTGRICMSASAVGSARTTLAVAVRYGGHRFVSGAARRPRCRWWPTAATTVRSPRPWPPSSR